MQLEESPLNNIAAFYELIFSQHHRPSRVRFSIELLVKFHRGEENSGELTETVLRSEIDRVVSKHLGKVGVANLQYSVEDVYRFDNEARLKWDSITSEQYCQLWAALAFQSSFRPQLKDIVYSVVAAESHQV